MTAENVLERHIEVTPGVRGGQPRVAGRRITVSDIVILHFRLGKSVEEIASEYDLSLADVYAALAYYFDHRDEIDERIEKDRAFAEAFRSQNPSLLQERLRDLRGEKTAAVSSG